MTVYFCADTFFESRYQLLVDKDNYESLCKPGGPEERGKRVNCFIESNPGKVRLVNRSTPIYTIPRLANLGIKAEVDGEFVCGLNESEIDQRLLDMIIQQNPLANDKDLINHGLCHFEGPRMAPDDDSPVNILRELYSYYGVSAVNHHFINRNDIGASSDVIENKEGNVDFPIWIDVVLEQSAVSKFKSDMDDILSSQLHSFGDRNHELASRFKVLPYSLEKRVPEEVIIGDVRRVVKISHNEDVQYTIREDDWAKYESDVLLDDGDSVFDINHAIVLVNQKRMANLLFLLGMQDREKSLYLFKNVFRGHISKITHFINTELLKRGKELPPGVSKKDILKNPLALPDVFWNSRWSTGVCSSRFSL